MNYTSKDRNYIVKNKKSFAWLIWLDIIRISAVRKFSYIYFH